MIRYILIVLGLCMGVSACQTAPVSRSNPSDAVEQVPLAANNHVGYLLYDPLKREVVENNAADQLFVPASAAKLFTAIAALAILGENHSFSTVLSSTGPVKNRIMKGNLYLRGGGDPLLKVADLMQMVRRLKATGVKQVEGSFYYDESLFFSQAEITSLEHDQDAPYNAGVGPLSVDFNQYFAQYDQNRSEWFVVPHFYQQTLEQPSHSKWMDDHDLSKKTKRRIPVRKPALFTALLFRQLCNLEGIDLPLPQEGFSPGKSRTIANHKSPPVIQMVKLMLEYSNNLIAESLAVMTAKKIAPQVRTSRDAAEQIAVWYRKKVPFFADQNFSLENGSGLTVNTRVSPRQMVHLLEFANQLTQFDLSNLLPVSGWNGTLEERLFQPETAFRVWAKTGTMDFISSLTGYFYAKSGRKFIFAIFSNDLLQRAENHDSKPWIEDRKKFQDELLSRWIMAY